MSHQDGFGNHGPEATGLTKSDASDDCMQKKSENVADAPDRIKLKNLKKNRLVEFAYDRYYTWPSLTIKRLNPDKL